MLRVAIIGGSGYTGLELLRILRGHSQVEVVAVTSRKEAGMLVENLFPSLAGFFPGLTFETPEIAFLAKRVDMVFTAVPHEAAMAVVPDLLQAGLKVIDLSADFRIHDQSVYEAWYAQHKAPQYLASAVYGLPELYAEAIKAARLVANPGCYPTSTILPLVPLLRQKLISHQGIIVDSKSGTSGAGRSPSMTTLFCEVNEGFCAYKVGQHRHTPEIEQELSLAAGAQVTINFTPHLLPISRGILTTIYADLMDSKTSTEDILAVLQDFYRNSPFVRILPQGTFPNVLRTRGSNYCDIGCKVDMRTGKLILLSAIDNLVKGASGQAVQNMNLMAGLAETEGLLQVPLYP